MIVVAVLVGLFVWFVVTGISSEVIFHTPKTGILEGLVAGIWSAWPIFHTGRVSRYNFLHPVPRRYKVPLKQAFSRVRQIIAEKNYNFGDKWHVSVADTMQRRITATLRFTEEESRGFDGTNVGNIQHRTQRVQRLLELDVQMKEEAGDHTVIQFDFVPRIEGVAWGACDSIISGIISETEERLGFGENAGNPADERLPAPPWWLLGLTAFGLLMILADTFTAVFGS
jgi:hypothetical protein